MTGEVAWIVVGRVARAHGLRGEVAVQALTDVPSRFRPGSRLYLGESTERSLTVESARAVPRRPIVKFREVGDRDAAESLGGSYLFVPSSESPPLPAGEFWPHDLFGCEVFTTGGRSLGRIREVLSAPANDLWVVEGEGGEVMVPALREVVLRVDVGTKRVEVAEVPGLTVDADEAEPGR